MVLHRFEDGVDSFLTKVLAFLVEGVCFVNKQHAAHSFFYLLLRLDRSLSDVTCYETRPVSLDQLSLAENADFLVQLGKDPGDSRFACTRISGEYKMQRNRHCLHALLLSHLSYLGKADHLLDIVLDLSETYKLVKLFHSGLLRFLGFFFSLLLSLSLNSKLRVGHNISLDFLRRRFLSSYSPVHRPAAVTSALAGSLVHEIVEILDVYVIRSVEVAVYLFQLVFHVSHSRHSFR